MRYLKYPVDESEKKMLEDVELPEYKDKYAHLVPEDMFEDLIAAVSVDITQLSKVIVDYNEIRTEAKVIAKKSKESLFDTENKMFTHRRDLIAFVTSDSFVSFKLLDIPYEEKLKHLLMLFQVMMMIYYKDPSVDKYVQKSSGQSSQSGMMLDFSNLLSLLVPPLDKEDGGGSGADRFKAVAQDVEDLLADKNKVMDLMKLFYGELYDVWELVRNFMDVLRQNKGRKKHDVKKISKSSYQNKMKSHSDIKDVLPKELASPVSDERIITKTARKKQYQEYEDKGMNVHVLLDHSGSMGDGHRMMFGKALLIAMGKKIYEEKGHLMYREFDDHVEDKKDLTPKKSWTKFIDGVVAIQPEGGTNIENALGYAHKDLVESNELEDSDIILISDGTEDVYAEEVKERFKGARITTILLDQASGVEGLKDASENFFEINTSNFEEAKKSGLKVLKVF